MTKVTFNSHALQELLRGPTGPVYQLLDDLGMKVSRDAKVKVGQSVSKPTSGDLRRSIKYQVFNTTREPEVRVGSLGHVGVGYGIFHHEGTRPHIIRPKPPKNILVFRGRGGRMVYIRPPRFVRHPGTSPVRYLTDSAAKYVYIRRTGGR